MYIKNEICYAGKMEDDIKVTEVKPLRGIMMLVIVYEDSYAYTSNYL